MEKLLKNRVISNGLEFALTSQSHIIEDFLNLR